ncbi:hypothetical protein MA16_Dca004435 [Dendrobium catenatum]|uniref:rRNA methylase YtqB n=1 Tax=Dendrobium catenatum TaxID=906689 RepID=A0A2I0W7F7_9ASPA|nr:hypothetical protein MA16_Dca004435 [Dendrobium catenatum]
METLPPTLNLLFRSSLESAPSFRSPRVSLLRRFFIGCRFVASAAGGFCAGNRREEGPSLKFSPSAFPISEGTNGYICSWILSSCCYGGTISICKPRIWKIVIRGGDTVVDATCGNGYDTIALLKLVADDSRRGCVHGLDIQSSALENTCYLLRESVAEKQRELVKLHLLCHSRMEDILPKDAAVRLIAFNLGYLPAGDKAIITKPHTTLFALQAASRIIASGGLISIVIYIGHPGGRFSKPSRSADLKERHVVRLISSSPPLQNSQTVNMSSAAGSGLWKRPASSSFRTPPPSSVAGGPLRLDIDQPPRSQPVLQALSFAFVLAFAALQLLPATHFRHPADPSRSWMPFSSKTNTSTLTKSKDPLMERLSNAENHDVEIGRINVVSWMDCLDLRMLAVLANSTLSSSSEDVKLSYYKLKVLFPDSNLDLFGSEVKWLCHFAALHCRVLRLDSDHGRIEELFDFDLGPYAIAATEDCSRRLSDYVNIDILNAIRRTAAKTWISEKLYDKDSCVPDLSLFLVNVANLDKNFLESIRWWNQVLDLKHERNNPVNAVIAVALYNKYYKLPDAWKLVDSRTASSEAKNIRQVQIKRKVQIHSSRKLSWNESSVIDKAIKKNRTKEEYLGLGYVSSVVNYIMGPKKGRVGEDRANNEIRNFHSVMECLRFARQKALEATDLSLNSSCVAAN